MSDEVGVSWVEQVSALRLSRAEEYVRRANDDSLRVVDASALRGILPASPSIESAAEALSSILSPLEILALIVSGDQDFAQLGTELAASLDADFLHVMAQSGNTDLAGVAGRAVLRAPSDAPSADS